MELGARIGLVLGVLFVAERLKMADFQHNFTLNETVASLSAVDGSPLWRPFACGSLSITFGYAWGGIVALGSTIGRRLGLSLWPKRFFFRTDG